MYENTNNGNIMAQYRNMVIKFVPTPPQTEVLSRVGEGGRGGGTQWRDNTSQNMLFTIMTVSIVLS